VTYHAINGKHRNEQRDIRAMQKDEKVLGGDKKKK
jgi:hypothetical protein